MDAWQAARRSVDDIVKDLSGRSGLGNEWEAVDDDIRDEIITKWRDIIEARIWEAEDDAL